ncbi:hypothetical protein K474DRAFT_1663178 [Panus rudis PR-1116 ss-1]|nr:hypothetical protein K474DRAFT_1663178 [Panus rudis PR-1116 ss-1]
MQFHPFEVSIPHIIYAVLGGFVVFFGMFSLFVREKLYIGEACWAFLFGVVVGPYGANIFNPRSWGSGDEATVNTITLEFTRVVLAIGVFAIGVELPKAYMKRHWKSLFFLLAPVMTWGWFVSAGLIYALIPGLNFLSSLAIAACLTPTDPILAAAVVGGKYADKHVPAHIRHLLAAESGCNDGAAYPFLFISLYLIIDRSTGAAISDWFLLLWLYQVILGIVLGALIGFGFRHLMKFCERKDLIDRQSYVAQYVSLAMLTIGSCSLLGTDDLLAAFSCGTAFAWDGFFNKQTEESVFSSVIDLLFNIAAFVFVGAWMPFGDFSNEHLTLSVWRLIVIAILVLILRRLPIMIALYRWIPDIKTFREAVFSGHFGPMGIGAIFISTLAAEQLPHPHDPPEGQTELLAASIQPIVAFMVLCSITIHGLSIPFFSLGRRVHSVSRTWSRHDTFGRHHSLPEWANQTRRVERGEEIVINRDRDLERGEVEVEEKRSRRESVTANGSSASEKEGMGEASSPTQTTSDEKERAHENAGEEEWGPMDRPEGVGEKKDRDPALDAKEENLPDGEETIQEWDEGPHRIIEKRRGPGEEVEVEVLRNIHAPGATHRNVIRTAHENAHETITNIRTRLRHAPQEFHDAALNVERDIQHEASEAGHVIHDAEDRVRRAFSPTQSQGSGQDPDASAPNAEEEEEGWMSDQEGEGSRAQRRPSKSSSKRPKIMHSKPVGAGRRRHSIRRGVLGGGSASGDGNSGTGPSSINRPIQHGRSYSEGMLAPDGEEGDRRGRRPSPREARSPTMPAPTTPTSPLSPRSLRHARVESLRSLRPDSRELSPARSIRWADETRNAFGGSNGNGATTTSTPGTGTVTPILMSPGSAPGSELPSEDELNAAVARAAARQDSNNSHSLREGAKEDDSPTGSSQTQVRFDVPPDHPPREHSSYHYHMR